MQSTGVLNLVIGLTGVTEKRGAHMSYISCPRPLPSLFRAAARFPPVSAQPLAYTAAAVAVPRHQHALTSRTAAPRITARSSSRRSFHARAARLSLPLTPPVRATAATHCCASQHHRHELRAAPAPRAAHAANTPRRSRSRSTFSLSARQVFEVLPV